MSRHARIEELSDSDSDPPDFDPSDFDPANQIITPADMPARAAVPQAMFQQQKLHEQLHPEQMLPQQMLQPQIHQETSADTAKYAHYQCIYPVYFDASRTRAEGRRVGKELAVENPLAREIVDAVAGLQLMTVFEPGKMHPKDWSNPGRVRVLLKDEDGEHQGGSRVKNKHHLYMLIAQYLKAHPTTEEMPKRLRITGMPLPDKPVPPPAVPKGWKVGSILPLHSPALSGGGVSDNFLKEMMQEMQGQGGMPGMPGMPPGMPGMPPGMGQIGSGNGGEGKKKKEKKKGKA